MMDDIVLSPEDMERLGDGEPVRVKPKHGHGEVTVNPPCEKHGHEWYNYNIRMNRDEEKHELTRMCRRCQYTEGVVIPDIDSLFNQMMEGGYEQ